MKCLSTPLTASVTALMMLLLVPVSASAFYAQSRSEDGEGNPVPIRFDTETPVEFRIDMAGMPGGDGSEVASIVAAFQAWEDVDCVSIDFEQGERTTAPMPRHWTLGTPGTPEFERYISVYWDDSAAQFPTPTVAFFDWAHDGTGTLIGGTIILNARDHDWSTTGADGVLDVQSVMTAMVGRVLGLTSAMEGNATFPRYAPGDISKRTLGDDDVDGITYLYGDDTCDMPGVPEDVCLGTPLEECPPTPDVDAGAGTRDGGSGPRDTGTGGTPDGGGGTGDAGAGGDAGSGGGGDDGGGCSVGELDAESTPGWIALLLFVGLALIRKRH